MRTDKDFIAWFHKKIVDLVYEKKLSSEVWKLFQEIVKEWEKQNERA